MAAAMTSTAGQLAPVVVSCTSVACGHQWLSRAKRHQPVSCPRCGRTVRVKRHAPEAAARLAASHPAPEPSLLTAHGPLVQADDDDEGEETWIRLADGSFVLGEWTDDGQLVPAAAGCDIAEEMAWRGYQVNHDAEPGSCQIDETRGLGRCQLVRAVRLDGINVCDLHHYALSRPYRRPGAA